MAKSGVVSKIIGGGLVALGAVSFLIPIPGIGAAIGYGLISAGSGMLAASFVPTPKQPDMTAAQQANRHTFRGAITPHKLIYGQTRISGPMYEIGSTGTNNNYLHVIIPLAGHELDSIGNIILNGNMVSGTPVLPANPTSAEQWRYDTDVRNIKKFANHIRIKRHLGGAGQVADPDLVAEFQNWTNAHVGNGIAYIYVRFLYNKDLFSSGIKNIQADVRGKKVFDPRTGNTAWSDNWALCIRDYLTSSYGMGMQPSEIDDSYIAAAANTSQEIVATSKGGTQNRYTLNGMVDLKNTPTQTLGAMLTAGAGSLVPLVEGKARLIPGSYSTPTITLTESDLRSGVSYKPHVARKALFNTVTGKYAGEDSQWKTLTYPQVGDAAAIAADGAVIRKEISLPYCTDHERCQRIAKLVLNQHRAGATLNMPCKLTALEATTMEVVNVKLPHLWTGSRTFRVISWNLNPDLGVDLVLKEDNAAIYAWNSSNAQPFVAVPPALTNTAPTIVQPGIPVRVNGLELSGQGNNTEFTGGDAHFVWRKTTAYDYQNIGSEIFGAGSGGFDAWFMGYDITILDPAGNIIRTDFTKDNWYDFTFLKNAYITGGPFRAFSIEVRIKGQQNQLSQPAKLSVSNPAPAAPTGLSITPSFDNVHITFTQPADLDFVGIEVYMSTTTGFTPDAASLKHTGNSNDIIISGLTSGTTYYFRVRGYDSFGKSGTILSTELAVTATKVLGSNITPGSLDYILFQPGITANIQAVPGISTVANTALSTANSASSTAQTAQSAANGAQITANAATSTANGASASASTALTATNTINGQLAASYSVRLKAGTNAVVGFGLTDGTGATSSFDIIASTFRLADANGNLAHAAFSVDYLGNVQFAGKLSGATGSFSGAVTAGVGSSIQGAYIQNLTVTTLQIGAESATIARFATGGATAITTFYIPVASKVILQGISQFPTGGGTYLQYKQNGTPTWITLESATILGGATSSLSTMISLSAGVWDFNCLGQQGTRLVVLASMR